MGRTARGIVAVAVAAAVAVAGCSGDDAPADGNASVITDPVDTSETTSSSTTTQATTTTEDPNEAVKREVEEAYLAYWDAVPEFFGQPNPQNPLIERHTAEAVFDATHDGITELLLDGQSIHRPENEDHFIATVLDVDPMVGRAGVSACIVDGLQIIDNATGEVINGDVITKLVRAELVLVGETWKVAQSRLIERIPGVHSCE